MRLKTLLVVLQHPVTEQFAKAHFCLYGHKKTFCKTRTFYKRSFIRGNRYTDYFLG